MSNISIMIVGVGGQGTLLTSRVLGNALLKESYDVKASEVHGMAQRGGSVVTYIKYGQKVHSPLIEEGEADYIIAFEELEALRWRKYLKNDGKLIINNLKVPPISVNAGDETYPENIIENLSKEHNILALKATDIASECGSFRATNIVLLGVLAQFLGIDKEIWIETINETVPKKTIEVNQRAFESGFSYSF